MKFLTNRKYCKLHRLINNKFQMKTKLLILLVLLLIVASCDDNSPATPSNIVVPNEWSREVKIDSVQTANRLYCTIDNKQYIIGVLDLFVYETEKNSELTNQAERAGISEDSALAIGQRAFIFAKELLINKVVTIQRDASANNSLPTGELLRKVIVDGKLYDSLMKANNLAATRKPQPDDSTLWVKVRYVYDGDTFDYKYDGNVLKVRILDIDCYETQINERLESQAARNKISVDSALSLGLAAKAFATQLLKDKTVLLMRSETAPNKDVYDRYLRYVRVNGMSYDSLIKSMGYDAKYSQ